MRAAILRLANAGEDAKLAFEDGAVRVFIDPKSYLFLEGSTLDFATTLMARGFKWVNPNVKGTCGCGESVTIVPAAEG